MNEINPKTAAINKISPVESENKKNRSLQKGDGSFNHILTNQLEQGPDNTTLKKTTTLSEIQGSFKAQQLNPQFNPAQFTQKLTASLNMLETYASWLGNPDKNLKQAYHLLEEVSARTKALAQEFETDTTSNTDLKQILTQLMTTVEVEQIKFNRGDYTD